jgi:glutaminase
VRPDCHSALTNGHEADVPPADTICPEIRARGDGDEVARTSVSRPAASLRFLAEDQTITIDEAVAASEQRTGFRNVALANYMKSFGVIENPVDYTLGVYFHHCAIAMSCRQLAMAARFLAYNGRNPSTGLSIVQPERARRINALMLMCGHYDGSGEFAYRVGLPGKSGVGGGILAIAPGKASIAVWSPGLDASGNSRLGRVALELLTKRLGWSVFGT